MYINICDISVNNALLLLICIKKISFIDACVCVCVSVVCGSVCNKLNQ